MRVLTPSGRGAVAVTELRCASNEEATAVLQLHFCSVSGADLQQTRIGRILYGRWRNEDVVLVRTNPATWEVHCHGGIAAVRSIARDLSERDATVSGRSTAGIYDGDLTLDSEIRRLLLLARTRKAAVHLLSQSDGRLADEISWIVESAGQPMSNGRAELDARLQQLLRWAEFAGHLVAPWRVLVLGRPNAGKSSLVNRIVGLNRSIVFDQPGTTRDIVEATAILDGWPFVFCDSAGLHDSADCEIEQSGMQAAVAGIRNCDLVLLVRDATDELQQDWIPFELRDAAKRVLVIRNKIDLYSGASAANDCLTSGPRTNDDDADNHRMPPRWPFHSVSARTGAGIPELITSIVHAVIPEEPPPGTALPLPGLVAEQLQTLLHRDSPTAGHVTLTAVRRLRALNTRG